MNYRAKRQSIMQKNVKAAVKTIVLRNKGKIPDTVQQCAKKIGV